LALILQRLKAQYAAGSYSRAPGWLASLEADGHWADVEYEDPLMARWHPLDHLGRLGAMASAYANPASPSYHSAAMLAGVERGLRYWFQRRPLSNNWWNNTIGQPLAISRTLVLLEDVLPPELLRTGLTYYYCPTEVDPWRTTGQNLVWYAQQQLTRGALARSPDDVAAASAAMQREIRTTTAEGIQPDFSFHQHGPQLYNGGYGLQFIIDTSRFAALLQGTRFAFPPEKLSLLADYLLEGSRYMIRGKLLDYSANGRALTRKNAGEGAVPLAAASGRLAALLPQRADELIALKKHIEGSGAPYSFIGNRYFWNSDFITHQREGYYISVKMVSNRTIGTETSNGENLKACWLPFGLTWIARRGDEYKNIFPVLDWGRLPGVTSAHFSTANVKRLTQPESFVGGVSDGTYGAAALDFDQMSTQGHKAWFFFDREMVALGAGIASTRDEPVATTLNQTLLRGPVLIDGQSFPGGESSVPQASWVLHDGVGYVFPLPAAINIKAGPQTGDWHSINAQYSDAPVTTPVFSLWIDHGVRPQGAHYAYAVLPDSNAQELAGWVAHPPVRILANTPEQQAAINDRLGIAEIVFHSPGSISLKESFAVRADRPCLVLMVRQGDAMRIAVSSPGGESPVVHLALTTPQTEQNIAFELPAGEFAGKSQMRVVSIHW
jgi:chondroitin AC lyase